MPKPAIPPGKQTAVDTKARALKAALPADDTRQTKLTELAKAKGGAKEPQVALNALPGGKQRKP